MNIDWKRKLTSRKFWAAVALFISGLLSFWCSDELAAKIVSSIMQAASVIGYIIGEGLVDAAREQQPADEEEPDDDPRD